jgi:hypothetical protein
MLLNFDREVMMKCFITCLLLVVIFASCDFQNTTEIDVPVEKEVLVANCFFTADSIWDVRVYKSRHSLAAQQIAQDRIQNASVVIMEGNLEIPLTYSRSLYSEIPSYKSKQTASIGRSYVLKVAVPGFKTITSTSAIPEPIPILDIKSEVTPDPDYAGSFRRNFSIRFKDPSQQRNYYSISMTFYSDPYDTWLGSRGPTYLEPTDPTTEKEYVRTGFFYDGDQIESLAFNDLNFDGNEYELKISASEGPVAGDDLIKGAPLRYLVRLSSMSEAYYNYVVTVDLQKKAKVDPFAQPVKIFNNIENGYGIFAGFGQSVVNFRVK